MTAFIIVSLLLAQKYWILDTGYWILDTGYWMLDIRYWILDSSNSTLLILSIVY